MAAELTSILFDNLSYGIVLVDPLGEILLINRRACELLHTEKAAVVGKRIDMLPLRTALYKVLSENSRERPVEVSFNHQVLAVHSKEFIDSSGISGEIVELRDVTAERQERRQREEFVAMMTHDLKSPLTVLMGYLQAMRNEMLDAVNPALKFCVEEAERSSHRLLGMIEDVLDAYRLEVGLLQITKGFSDLRTLLASCSKDFSQEADAQGLSFRWTVDELIPPMKVDGKQLSRVFGNLLANAIKFTPRHGSIALDATQQNEEVVITVSDTGIGVSPEDQKRIFTKYFRAAGASGFKGTGLGLTISKAIVEAHGGSIEVSSSEGQGSCFTVRLPTKISSSG
jgi:signal transduction histidine kinase